jgi:hypothetical protein
MRICGAEVSRGREAKEERTVWGRPSPPGQGREGELWAELSQLVASWRGALRTLWAVMPGGE